VSAGGIAVDVTDARLAEASAPLVEKLVADGAASKLAAGDDTLWGPEAQPEASKRLSWVRLHETSRPLVDELAALRRDLHGDGADRVVLAGMGGSSLAPEVICATASGTQAAGGAAGDHPLVVLDTTDPGQVSDALAGDLSRTVLVVSSKSGSTVETDSQRRVFEQVFEANGIDAASRIVVVTDPGSGLAELGREQGYRKVVEADPDVGGRYSALTAFGLVPSALAGVNIATLLDEAAAAAPALERDAADNPAVQLAAALGAAHAAGAEKVVLADTGSGLVGFGNWAEQLIAESTGKQGVGLLPVVVEGSEAPGFADHGTDATAVAIGPANDGAQIAVTGTLGGQFLLWEYAIALAGRLIGINPFDQPDVESAKQATRDLLAQAGDGGSEDADGSPLATDGPVEIRAEGGDWLGSVTTVGEAVQALVDAAPDGGYVAIQAYLDRLDDASFATLRPELAKAGLQTTFGWGPRFLHSTGQYHKGGHQNGVFLQITGSVADDLAIPDQPFSFGVLEHAQARGDAGVLAAPKNGGTARPVLRLHLADRAAGLVALAHAVSSLHGREVRP
jgi:glucose-6-phosphate isomerase